MLACPGGAEAVGPGSRVWVDPEALGVLWPWGVAIVQGPRGGRALGVSNFYKSSLDL